jgi:predicted secreted acid phosphatase
MLPAGSACAGGGSAGPGRAAPEAAGDPAAAPTTSAVHWTRDAAEHDALMRQTYRWAGARLRERVVGLAAGTWAVILDADETILDNSEYQKERLSAGGGFSADSWTA